jgi:hypothetical protein
VPDQLLGLGAFTQPDLEHLLAVCVQRLDAGRQVRFLLVAELVIVGEELVVITAETAAKPADLRVPARMSLPEFLDRLLVHADPPTPVPEGRRLRADC